jgi:hypothetical protein
LNYRLGKLPAKADLRRLRMALFTSAVLAAPPATCDRTYGLTDWTPMGNSGEDAPPPGVRVCGDCAYAGIGHAIMAWSLGAAKKPLILSANTIVDAYAAGTGYDPATGAGDNGAALINVLEQHRTIGIGGNKNVGYAGVDLTDPIHTRQAIYYFGGAYVGLMLPQTAMEQTQANLVWTKPWYSETIGGHCVYILSYDATHIWCITWGQIQCMTWEFFFAYCDESFVIVDPLWIGENDMSPVGLNIPALIAAQNVVNARSLSPPVQIAA